MGTLRCYEWIENEDGTKTSAAIGLVINGVLLGQPVELDDDPATAEFDDSAFCNGVVMSDGTVIPDEEPVQ